MPSYDYPTGLTSLVGQTRRDLRRFAIQKHPTIPFTLPGALTVSTSPPWVPDFDAALTEIRCLLGTVGGGTTVVTVYVNGTSQGTVTCNAANVSASFSVTLTADTDVLKVGVTTADATAKDLTVLARFS